MKQDIDLTHANRGHALPRVEGGKVKGDWWVGALLLACNFSLWVAIVVGSCWVWLAFNSLEATFRP